MQNTSWSCRVSTQRPTAFIWPDQEVAVPENVLHKSEGDKWTAFQRKHYLAEDAIV